MAAVPDPPGDADVLADLAAAVDLLADAATAARGLPDDIDYPTADDLLDATADLDRHITRALSARAELLRAVAHREAYKARGYVTAASWWRDATRRDHTTASRHVRTAVRLGDLDAFAVALDDAEITLEHAEAVTAACTPGRAQQIRDGEAILIALARNGPPRHLRIACRRIADLVDEDGTTTPPEPEPDDDNDDRRDPDRGLSLHQGFAGRWRLEGDLEALVGERLHNLLEALDTPDDPDTDAADRRSHAQRRHDAFARLVAAAEQIPDLARRHGAKPHVLVIIDLLTLLGHDACATRRARLASGGQVAVDAALELLEEAKVTAVLQLGPWRSVAVGRTHRVLPDWLRPLLTATHRHCRGPGCDRPIAWTQAAHLDAWAPGGHTDLHRTLPACTAHHQLIDMAGWRIHYDPDTNKVTWTRPDDGYTTTTEPPEP